MDIFFIRRLSLVGILSHDPIHMELRQALCFLKSMGFVQFLSERIRFNLGCAPKGDLNLSC